MAVTTIPSAGIDQTGSFDFTSGLTLGDNLLFDASSKGVYLGVTSATAANLLDDFEEGTWTPQLFMGSSQSTGATYGAQEGFYQKIGKYCTLKVRIELTSKGSSTGQAGIGNLPFDPADDFTGVNFENAGAPLYSLLQNLNSRIINCAFVHVDNKSIMYGMQGTGDGNNFSLLDNTMVTDTTSLRAMVTYKTT